MNKLMMVIDAQCNLYLLHSKANQQVEMQQDIVALNILTQRYIEEVMKPPAVAAPPLGIAVAERVRAKDEMR